jgi:hypothetical protein
VSAKDDPRFGEVFTIVKRVAEARGVRPPGEFSVTYSEGDLSLVRTPINEYEVRVRGRAVFRARHTGALSSHPVFEPGDWMEQVRRMAEEIRRGGKK